jgi:hypothetical protein
MNLAPLLRKRKFAYASFKKLASGNTKYSLTQGSMS